MINLTGKFTSRKLQSSYVSTIVGISLVLFMVGLLGEILVYAQKLSDFVKENIELSISFKPEVKEVEAEQFRKTLDASGYIKTTVYITPQEAAERLQKDLGEDFVSFLGYNPLLPSIDVRLKAAYANADSLKWIEKNFTQNPLVKEIYYQRSLVDKINENLRTIGFVILLFCALLAVIAIALINNTIRLALYSKRFLIRSMQLVGATQKFIRKPFLQNSLLHGLYAGVMANIVLIGVLYIAQRQIPDLMEIQQDIEMFALVFLLVIVAGMLVSYTCTYFALKKYLKIKLDDLYI